MSPLAAWADRPAGGGAWVGASALPGMTASARPPTPTQASRHADPAPGYAGRLPACARRDRRHTGAEFTPEQAAAIRAEAQQVVLKHPRAKDRRWLGKRLTFVAVGAALLPTGSMTRDVGVAMCPDTPAEAARTRLLRAIESSRAGREILPDQDQEMLLVFARRCAAQYVLPADATP